MEDLIWLYDYDGSVLWFSFTSATSFVSSTTPICLFVCISPPPHSLLLERRQEFGKFDDIYFAATLLNVPTRHLSFLNIVQCASVAFINILCFCQHCGHVLVLSPPHGQNLCFLWYKNKYKNDLYLALTEESRCISLIGIHHLNILTVNWQRVLDISQGFFSAYISELLQHYIVWSSAVATQALSRTTNNQCLATPRQL